MANSLVGADLARVRAKSVRNRTALSRVNGYFTAVIEAIAAAKLRRLQRELALRGVRYPFPEQGRIPSR